MKIVTKRPKIGKKHSFLRQFSVPTPLNQARFGWYNVCYTSVSLQIKCESLTEIEKHQNFIWPSKYNVLCQKIEKMRIDKIVAIFEFWRSKGPVLEG